MATPLSPVLDCTEFVAAEGRYELLKDMHLDQVLPHPVIPTHVSTISVQYNNHSGGRHGKQTSDSTLSTSNISRLDEHLKEVKLSDEDEANRDTMRSFHGSVDSPYNEDGYISPGFPPKDSSGSNRPSDPYAQYGAPPTPHQTSFSHKSLSRANSHHLQNSPDEPTSSQSSSSASFSSFFGGKRKKPKNNITKTNSTFVAKITTHENLSKIIANRFNEDVYLFWNTGRTFTWSDVNQKPNEPLSHITFSKAIPTSHDVNVLTRSSDHLDVIIGFNTGDIIWFDPLSNKYYRLNKQGLIKDSPVTVIKWMPGSETQFMAAFQDGSILIMDKERDDVAFTVPNPPTDNGFHVTRPKHGKHNPISHWQVSKKPITAFASSPDLQHVAVVGLDGGLRVIDIRTERLLDTFQSYFGALNCVCWSPDGKYILTGGQDDLVTIWSFKDQRIVARCQGHQSYVTGVAFDPWRCDERNYRFGSVGEDAKLLLWDFSVGALHKPKAAMQRRGSNATVLGNGTNGYKPGHKSKGSITSLRGHGGHSLFSGNKSQSSATHSLASAASQLPSVPSTLPEEPSLSEGPQDSGASSISSSRHNSNYDAHVASNTNNNQTNGDATSLTSVSSRSSVGLDSTSQGSNLGLGLDGPLSPVYKKSDRAKTLPHLHLHKSNGSSQNATHGFSSLFKNSSSKHLASGVHGHGHGHGHGHDHEASYVRPAEPRSHVAMLQPMMAKSIHAEPLASLTFREDAILTSDRRGHIKVWKRPTPVAL
ncbi:hypothetical protein BGZ82_007479 [Podila clonocystis]|nr:hypothetical protein BGZ82_007479 [Podila clonocystis]